MQFIFQLTEQYDTPKMKPAKYDINIITAITSHGISVNMLLINSTFVTFIKSNQQSIKKRLTISISNWHTGSPEYHLLSERFLPPYLNISPNSGSKKLFAMMPWDSGYKPCKK